MSNGFPLLSLCLFWPLLGALPLAVPIGRMSARRWALAVAGLELLFCLWAFAAFRPEDGDFQLVEDHPWIPGLNARFLLGVDGISIGFLPMTALVTLAALLTGWNAVQRLNRFYLGLLLALESVTIGVFTALDTVLFFLFWELTLPPLFFLIGLWGLGPHRRYAAMKYTLYMLFGGVPLLFAFILLATAGEPGALPVFGLPELLRSPLPVAAQTVVFGLLLLGFAVKAPLLPFHTWLPTVAMEAPPQIAALLLGLKLGVYGIVRFAIPLAPAAASEYRWPLAIGGAVTLIYGALVALRQTNLRRLLAYAGVSHVGMVILGIASFNLLGLQGALMQLLNFASVAASLMLIAGMLQQRLGSNDALQLGGLARPLPRLTALFFLFALSSIGVPGGNGFPAELLMIFGILQAYPVLALVALLGAVLGAAYTLDFIRKGFFGPLKAPELAGLRDLRGRELAALIVPALLVLALGLSPQWLLSRQEATLTAWLSRVNPPALKLAPVTGFHAPAADRSI